MTRMGWMGFAAVVGCSRQGASEADAVAAVKDEVAARLGELHAAAERLQDAAPAPTPAGWTGGAALDPSKDAWREARVAYERVEGAIAVLFPDLDYATDARYEDFLAEGADEDPFDGEGVTGVHAVERIVWADRIPAEVVAFESGITGYTPASFPADDAQASAYRDALVQRLVDDVEAMEDDFAPLALDAAAAYGGVVGSMAEQLEKVNLAATGEEESRYAQHTLADMRANLAGGRAIYAAFSGWIAETPDGEALDAAVLAGFDRLDAAYGALEGDGLPAVPVTWNPEDPAPDDRATDYGALWTTVTAEADPDGAGSLVAAMVAAADAVGIAVAP